MTDIFEVLKALNAEDRAAFEKMMDYCDGRVTADEGIPAVIALDDISGGRSTGAFQPAGADRDMGLVMATCALLYTNLYENREKKDEHYPAICPAMSAVAESCFREERADDGQLKLVPYSDVVGPYLKPKAKDENGQ